MNGPLLVLGLVAALLAFYVWGAPWIGRLLRQRDREMRRDATRARFLGGRR